MPSRLSLFWEELSALAEIYVLPSLLWIFAFWLDVIGRVTVNTISLLTLFVLYVVLKPIFNAVLDNHILWMPQRRRSSLLVFKGWRSSLDLCIFVAGHVVGYLLWEDWERRDAAWLRRSPWVFVTQALHFDIAVYLTTMILPDDILMELHTTGTRDKHTAGFMATLASVASLSWLYHCAFHFISQKDVDHWNNTSTEVWLVGTVTTVAITLTMLKTPIVRQGLKYIVLHYMAFIFSLLERIAL